MPFPPEPLYYALFYLRCFLESFVISGLGLQIMGQSPRLSTLFKFSLLAGVLLFLLYLAPLGPAGLLTAIALVLILALRQTRQAGLFVTTAAVLLGLYLLVHVRWLLVQLRLFLDLPGAADLSRDFLPALLQEAPALLVPAALVCVVAFFQARARAASTLSTSASEKYGSRFRGVDKHSRRRLIAVSQLFTVLLAAYIINTFYTFDLPWPAATLLPFGLSAVIILSAYVREARHRAFASASASASASAPASTPARSGSLLLEYVELLTLAPFIHFALQVSGGPASPFKLLFIPFVLAQGLKLRRVYGLLAFLLSAASLYSLATIFNPRGMAWNLELDLLYLGLYLATLLLAWQYGREESRWQQVLKTKNYTDHVTGLANYHYVRDFLYSRPDDEASELYLMVIDLDGFKIINDRFGHPGGDLFLHRIGQAIKQEVFHEDIIARYGGDDFIVVMKNEKEERVLALARRIQEVIRREAASFLAEHGAENLVRRFTASIGISRSFNAADGRAWLLTQADQNLREAQSAGGGQMVFREIDDIPQDDDPYNQARTRRTAQETPSPPRRHKTD